jgi:hypothetical protein
LITGGLGVMVVWMNVRAFSITEIFLATWSYDFFAAAGFYMLSDLSGYDITLGRSLRRSADAMIKNGITGRILSGLLLIGVSVKAIIWEGPEVLCFLFKKELKTRSNIWLALFVLSAIQGVFGTWLYTTGYELWTKYGSSELSLLHIISLGIATLVIFTAAAVMMKKLAQWAVAAGRYWGKCSRTQKLIAALGIFIVAVLIFLFLNSSK